MVKKVILFFLIIWVLSTFQKCISSKDNILICKQNSLNSKICSGIYLHSSYIYKYRTEKIKLKDGNFEFNNIKTDSTSLYQGYRFFTNGTLRIIQSQKSIDKDYILDLLNKRVKDKSNWGVYELKKDTLIMQQFEPSQGLPINETIGTINDNKLKEIKVRSLTYNKKFVNISNEYIFYPIVITTDSTAEFIKTQ